MKIQDIDGDVLEIGKSVVGRASVYLRTPQYGVTLSKEQAAEAICEIARLSGRTAFVAEDDFVEREPGEEWAYSFRRDGDGAHRYGVVRIAADDDKVRVWHAARSVSTEHARKLAAALVLTAAAVDRRTADRKEAEREEERQREDYGRAMRTLSIRGQLRRILGVDELAEDTLDYVDKIVEAEEQAAARGTRSGRSSDH